MIIMTNNDEKPTNQTNKEQSKHHSEAKTKVLKKIMTQHSTLHKLKSQALPFKGTANQTGLRRPIAPCSMCHQRMHYEKPKRELQQKLKSDTKIFSPL